MHPLLAASVANALFTDRVGTARPRPVRRGAATSGPSARKAVATPVADASDVVIRTAGADDAPALARLGALDGNRRAGELLAAAADEHSVLVAEVDGPIEAALALDGDTRRRRPVPRQRAARAAARAPRPPARRRRARAAAAARSACCTRARRNVSGGAAARPVRPARPPDLGVAGAADDAPAPQRRPPRRAVHAPHRVDRRADGRRHRPRRRARGLHRARRRRPRRRELELPRAVRRPELDPDPRRPRAPAPAQADAAAVPRRPHARAPRPDRRASRRPRSSAGRAASRSPPTRACRR